MRVRKSWFGFAGLLAVTIATAQQPSLQITSPADGAFISVGQALTVNVSAFPSGSVSQVGLLASDPLEGAAPLANGPYQFNLDIPASLPYGRYEIVAVGSDSLGRQVFSPPVSISAEPTIPLEALTVQPIRLKFQFIGQQLPLLVYGKFADGTIADLTNSDATLFSSTNTQNVTANQTGMVTAIGGGTGASVVVQRGTLSVSVPVTVPVSIRGDLNGDGVVDRNDLNIIMIALNTPASVPFDARDLNRDGVINALDARILVTLCTRPGCATPTTAEGNVDKGRMVLPAQPAQSETNIQIFKLPVH